MNKKIEFLNSIRGWLSLELTNFCNFKCSYCYREYVDKLPKQFISYDLVVRLLDELEDEAFHFDGIKLNWLGESMTHPQYYEIMERVFKSTVFDSFSQETNLYFYNHRLFSVNPDDKPYYLFISLDTLDNQRFNRLRGNDSLDRIIENINSIIEKRKELNRSFPRLRLQFIVMKDNFDELCTIKDKINDLLGIDKVLFHEDIKADYDYILFRPLVTREDNDSNTEIFNKLKKFYGSENEDFTVSVNKQRRACEKLFSSPFVRADGTIIFCSNDPEMALSPGNIKYASFKQLWIGEYMEKLRRQHIEENWNKLPVKCRKCIDYWCTISDDVLKRY